MVYKRISAKRARVRPAQRAVPRRVLVSIGKNPNDGRPTTLIFHKDHVHLIETKDTIELAQTVLRVLDEQPGKKIGLRMNDVPITISRHEAREMALCLVFCAGMLQMLDLAGHQFIAEGFEMKVLTKVLLRALSQHPVTVGDLSEDMPPVDGADKAESTNA